MNTKLSRSSSFTRLLLSLVVAPALGCGLVQVNGKPLATNPSSSSSDGDASSAGGGGDGGGGTASTGGGGDKSMSDIAEPDPKAPVTSWTPVQQSMENVGGYGAALGRVVLADELGDKLSQLGRLKTIEICFKRYGDIDAKAAVQWAVCGDDVRAASLDKADAEMKAEGLNRGDREQLLGYAKDALDDANKVGVVVEAAAKEDAGVAAILAAGKAARAEWKAFASANAPLLHTVRGLQDAVRKGSAKAFAGCADRTRPAFEKLVRGQRFTDNGGDPLVSYVDQLRGKLDSHMVTMAYGACASGLDASGEGLYAAIGNGDAGTVLRGERTYVLMKLLASSFKPKFDDRALKLSDMMQPFVRTFIKVPGNWVTAIMTPNTGKIAKVTTSGDVTMLSFAKDKVEKCLEWRTTDRIASIRDGEVRYEQECGRRGLVDNQIEDTEIATVFASGLKAGMMITMVNKFPVVAWTGKVNHVLLGVSLK